MKHFKYLGIAMFVLIAPVVVNAGMYGAFPNSAVLEKGVTEDDDYYVASGNIDISGDVMGDAVLGGGNVFVSGTVGQDVLAAGGVTILSGAVGDDVRAAGGTVMVKGTVGDDLVVAGGTVTLSPGSSVKGDATLAGGTITVSAPVTGDLRVAGGTVTIDAPISGNVYAGAGELILGEHAVISGDLSYKSGAPAQISAGAKVLGQTTYTEATWAGTREERQGILVAMFGMWVLVKIAILFGVGVLLHLLFGRMSVRFVEEGLSNFWKHALRGLIVLIVVPVVAVFGMITVVGIPVSLAVLALYGILLALGCIYAPILIGTLALKVARRDNTFVLNWKTIFLGAVIATIVGFIPVVGGIANFVFFIVALGVIAKNEHDRFVAAR